MYRKDHIPELDGLRGIAVLLVLWVHLPAAGLGSAIGNLRGAIMPGNVGVDLFFVLSGFLITRILLVDRQGERALRHFLMRRFLRIFPIYYLLLLLLSPWMQWHELLACATYTSNYAFLFKDALSLLEHTWSLAIEEHFYLLWPPVVVFFSTRTSRRVLLYGVLPLSLITALLVLLLGDWEQESHFLTVLLGRGSTSRFGSLAAGALLAYHEGFVRRGGWRPLALAVGLISLSLALSKNGLAITGLRAHLLRAPGIEGDMRRLLAMTRVVNFPAMSLGVLLLAVIHTGRAWPWVLLLRTRVLGAIGRISYGLYLYHYPIFFWMLRPRADSTGPGPADVLLALAASFAAAAASYWILERPIMKLSARFREPRKTADEGQS